MARAEQRARCHHAVAGLEVRQQRGTHSSHAGRSRAACLGALDQRQALLEHGDGRIVETRILVVRDRAGESRLGLLGAVIDEARGQEERFGGLAESRCARRRRGPAEAGGEGAVSDRASVGHCLGLSQAAGKPMPAEGSAVGCLRTRPRGLFSALVSPRRNPAGQITRGLAAEGMTIEGDFKVCGLHRQRRPPMIERGRGCSSMAEHQLPKLNTGVRFPSPAPRISIDCRALAARNGLFWHTAPYSAARPSAASARVASDTRGALTQAVRCSSMGPGPSRT